jgi:hypothetical protein
MTDYISALGQPGPYHGEATRLAATLRDPAHATIVAGVIRWNSNDRVPPEDVVALAAHIGLEIDTAACTAARDTETRQFLAEYRKARAGGPTAEERGEARAAFGPGVNLVDVITGHKWRT